MKQVNNNHSVRLTTKSPTSLQMTFTKLTFIKFQITCVIHFDYKFTHTCISSLTGQTTWMNSLYYLVREEIVSVIAVLLLQRLRISTEMVMIERVNV